MAGKLVSIDNHVPFIVTQEDVKEYGCLESAVYVKTVEAELVCNETVCIKLKIVINVRIKILWIDKNLNACVFRQGPLVLSKLVL